MADNYPTTEQINHLLESGGRKTKAKIAPEERAAFTFFYRQFYTHTPCEYLENTAPEDLYASAKGMWDFIKERPADIARKVRVFNPDSKKDGWTSPRTIVETCTLDSPFILDSLMAELHRHGYMIYEVMHPMIRIKRNEDGILEEFLEEEHADSMVESVMHFQISHIEDDEELQELHRHMDNVLYFVNLAVQDWRPMRLKALEVLEDISSGSNNHPDHFSSDYVEEVKDFLRWVLDNNFILIGYCQYQFPLKQGKRQVKVIKGSELGVFRAEYSDTTPHEAKPQGLHALPKKMLQTLGDNGLIEITKSSRKSVIHRPVHMDYIGIKMFDANKNLLGEHRLLGLFTSSVYYQSAITIPIIRKKIEAVVRRANFKPDSHNGKALVAVMEDYPRDELLQIDEDLLFKIGMGIVKLAERPSTRLFVRHDRFGRFVSCIVFIARDRFNTQVRIKMQAVLEEAWGGQVRDYYTQVTESPLARVHLLVKVPEDVPEPDISEVEQQLVEITDSWFNGLRARLAERCGERQGEQLFFRYIDAFPEAFKAQYTFGGTCCDILKMESAYESASLTLDFYQREKDSPDQYQLKLYHPSELVALSDILPVLENMGFKVIDELTYFITPSKKEEGIWVHHLQLQLGRKIAELHGGEHQPLVHFKHELEQALLRILGKELESDSLNKLILRANIKWREVMMLRAYSKYIIQMRFPYSHIFMASAVARHPRIAVMLVELFNLRFDPAAESKTREKKANAIVKKIEAALLKVENIAEDRVLHQFFAMIQATIRTNYFQLDEHKEPKTYISFKLDSTQIPNLPKPTPFAEIFVYSQAMEGVHLRGAKVARGGLRWSDRTEDFRTEVLGLVKAQMVKNAVIVPQGSKGGFVVKHPVEGSREEKLEQGIACYRMYLSGLLDITDNMRNGKIVTPKNVVRHDHDDPYLVVAADKGTATFSDIANEMSARYQFWLGDAFASGGSNGYDHKKMGITARGAWVSVRRHFMETGKDIQKEDFTVVGIGDMSGDVFGNGMLLSKHIQLLAAFNHLHIFIDPSPDAAISFKERQRLFKKPRSSWEDYNKELLSKGGAIFERTEKSLSLSKEIRERFGIEEKQLSPEALIRAVLKAEVDLLWNGGIGTYVKATNEAHEHVGDKTNDSVRVNADELGCKVVGEGGNLGLTQLARIQYARRGGCINTDAIDNSAGVDCSDHEVNMKIAFGNAVARGGLTTEKRNDILANLTDNVASLVLRDNWLQTQAITIAEQQGVMALEQNARLMQALEEKALLDRHLECLPSEEEMKHRYARKEGLTRPELSVLLAYAKLDVFEELIHSHLPDDPYFSYDLELYFPEPMRKTFAEDITSHPLRREIIATSVSNSIVNRAGASFFQRLKENTGMKGCDVARAYTAARDAFHLRELWEEIETLSQDKGHTIPVGVFVEMQQEIRTLIERTTSWFLRNADSYPIDTGKIIQDYREGIQELSGYLNSIMSPVLKETRDVRLKHYMDHGIESKLAHKISSLEAYASCCDIVHVANRSSLPIRMVGEAYFALGKRLRFGWLRSCANVLRTHAHWDNLALQTVIEILFDQQMRLTAAVTGKGCNDSVCQDALTSWYDKNAKALARYDAFIADLKQQDNLTSSMLTVAIQRVEALCNGQ